jgi:hypothetical protein
MFAEFPETEALFVRDVSGAVRGEMLAVAFQCLLDLDGSYGANLIRAERINHEGWGVTGEAFVRFFPILMETCREVLGGDWTPEVDAAWAAALARIEGLVRI